MEEVFEQIVDICRDAATDVSRMQRNHGVKVFTHMMFVAITNQIKQGKFRDYHLVVDKDVAFPLYFHGHLCPHPVVVPIVVKMKGNTMLLVDVKNKKTFNSNDLEPLMAAMEAFSISSHCSLIPPPAMAVNFHSGTMSYLVGYSNGNVVESE